jgi:hypothetical protein
MRKYLFTIMVTALSVGFLHAQRDRGPHLYYTAAWNVGLPVFDYSKYISSVSLNGGAFQMQFFVQEQISVGVSFGWNTYYEETHAVYNPSPGEALSAMNYRYLNATPLKASVNYFFRASPKWKPYIGLGWGATYMTEHTRVQQVNSRDAQWRFLAAPEIGLFVPLRRHLGIHLSAAYTITIASKFGNTNLNSIHTIGISAGISYML